MGKADKYNYGVVLDAGSSGTRVYIYRWLKSSLALQQPELHKQLPKLETKDKWTKKVHPGVSTFGQTPSLVGTEHLEPLIKHALDHVPKESVPNTPIFLLATAGMRLLPDNERESVLNSICTYIQKETEFYIPDCNLHIQVIPGETEGLYGWIAANYLLGGFDAPDENNHGKGHHTYGFLDMGGASAQIAFAPNQTEAEKHANDLTLLRLRTINGQSEEYRVFVTTWLGFGVNEARRRYVKTLVDTYGTQGSKELPDPCLPKDARISLDGKLIGDTENDSSDGKNSLSKQHLVGTGKFDECLRRTFPLLEKEKICLDEPCLINGQHVPAIDFDVNHFVGISEYWHTTHEIFEMAHKDKSYDFNTYQQRVSEFCSQDWTEIEEAVGEHQYGKKVDEKTAYEVCFKASWIINMLHDGIGIPRVGNEDTSGAHNGTKEVLESGASKGYLDSFQAANEIRSTEVSWTMGKMVLYASAGITPAGQDDLPVGFGSNEAGIPADFQLPGGGRLQPGSEDLVNQSLADQISDKLFQSDAPHRVPGFIFFLFIIFIGIFYIRRRRATNGKSAGYVSGKADGPSLLSSFNRLLGRRGKSTDYDRELEEGGQRLYDPDDFELGNIESDDEAGAMGSRPNSGYSSPGTRRGKITPHTVAGRLSPEILDRRGLVVRTESRERLDLAGRKSRNGSVSPTRLKR